MNAPTTQTYPATGLQAWTLSLSGFSLSRKSWAIGILAVLFVGQVGSFLTPGELPGQNEPRTVTTLTREAPKKNLTDLRAAYRAEYQNIAMEAFASNASF